MECVFEWPDNSFRACFYPVRQAVFSGLSGKIIFVMVKGRRTTGVNKDNIFAFFEPALAD